MEFSGGQIFAGPGREIASPNLTPDATGIGNECPTAGKRKAI